jgi:hypothetical protein
LRSASDLPSGWRRSELEANDRRAAAAGTTAAEADVAREVEAVAERAMERANMAGRKTGEDRWEEGKREVVMVVKEESTVGGLAKKLKMGAQGEPSASR